MPPFRSEVELERLQQEILIGKKLQMDSGQSLSTILMPVYQRRFSEMGEWMMEVSSFFVSKALEGWDLAKYW